MAALYSPCLVAAPFHLHISINSLDCYAYKSIATVCVALASVHVWVYTHTQIQYKVHSDTVCNFTIEQYCIAV